MNDRRRLGLVGATGIGVGSMLGAGVFVVWGPAADAAGGLLLVALGIAALVAALNAASTAALAARHPVAGGNYSYGSRELRGPWGFVAGSGFVIGKTASVAAMALAIGAYVWPEHARLVATGAIIALWLINAAGVTRTAAVTGGIAVVVVLATVAALVSASLGDVEPREGVGGGGLAGVLQGAALLFFAFAGYARLATLGEEVREPRTTIPVAIAIALCGVTGLYAATATFLVSTLGVGGLQESITPLADAAGAGIVRSLLAPVATLAAGGALLALMAGMGRTAMAMAREADLPRVLARTNARGVPALAEGVIASVAIALVWTTDVASVIAASSCAVLLYYAVGHAAAIAARKADRTFAVPAWLAAVGLASCVALAVTLPVAVVVATAAFLALVVGLRALLRRPAR